MNIAILGINFHLFELPLLFALGFLFLKDCLFSGFSLRVRPTSWSLVFVAGLVGFLCAILLSFIHAYSNLLVWKSFFKWIEISLLALLIFLTCGSRKRFLWVYYYFTAACLASILAVFYSVASGTLSIFNYRIFPSYESAMLFALVLPLLVYRFSFTTALLSLIALAGTLLSLSRAAWLSLILVAGYAYHIFENRIKKRILFLIALVAIVGVTVPQVRGLVQYKISSFFQRDSVANNERANLITRAWQAFEEHPLTGIGALNFPEFISQEGLLSGIFARDVSILSPHNYFLQILAEEGILGIVPFLVLLFALFMLLFRRNGFSHVDAKTRHLVFGLQFVFIVLFVNLLFGYIASQFRFYFAILIGLALALQRQGVELADESHEEN